MATYTPNYNLSKPEATDTQADFISDYCDNMDIIDSNLGGGGGSGGHTIYDKDGNALAQESGLQFTGSVSVTDDALNEKTIVNVSGGSNLILDAQIYSTEEKQVGVWTDNKPLYCKTVQTAIPNNSQVSYAHNISDIDKIIDIKGGAWGSNQLLPINMTGYVYGSNEGALRVTVTNTDVVILPLGWDGSGYTGYWNIYYTKTTDVAGSGGFQAYGFSPVIYSDVERCIGVWRDNKPLYQRSWAGTKSTSNDEIIINDPPSIDTLANSFVTFKGNTGTQIAQYFRDSSDRARVWLEGTDLKVHMDSGNSYPIMPYTYTVTLQYTKTTDVAGSGDYNTYGVPTQHYSTSEQVIGTWIDGKTLYQKTVTGLSVALDDGNWVFSNAVTGIDNIIDLTCYSINSGRYLTCAISEYRASDSNEIQLSGFQGYNRTINAMTVKYTKI